MIGNILERVFGLNYLTKQSILFFVDGVLIVVSFTLAMLLRYDSLDFVANPKSWLVLLTVIPLTITCYIWFGLYRAIIRYISIEALIVLLISVGISAITMLLVSQYFALPVPRSVPFIYLVLLLIIAGGTRLVMRLINQAMMKDNRKPVAIYGAGEAGRQLLNSLDKGFEYCPIIFIDDNPKLSGREIHGIRIYSYEKALKFFEDSQVNIILIAMPSISRNIRKNIIDQLSKYPVQIKVMPAVADLIEGKTLVSEMRNISIEELLSREPVTPKQELLEKNIKDKVVLVSGAGGSIGSELCRQIVLQNPKVLVLVDHSEFALYNIHQELTEHVKSNNSAIELVPLLTSITNKQMVSTILKGFKVQTIYHAAAYKHVPLVEMNVLAAIKNNFLGTWILSRSAVSAKVESFILISSDKAVRPTNYMGASKRLAELACQALADKNTVFSIVRFGNVLGSSGSVIPLFTEQIRKGGPITVTHKDINRYFMTIPEASQLVIQAGSMAEGGEVFVLDMGKPVKIIELAERMARLHGMEPYIVGENKDSSGDIAIEVVGLRSGEKLYEELLIEENAETTSHPKILKANELSISKKELNKIISEIEVAAQNLDMECLKDILLSTPTQFKPSNNLSDLIWRTAQ